MQLYQWSVKRYRMHSLSFRFGRTGSVLENMVLEGENEVVTI